jgi:hypothetical protein
MNLHAAKRPLAYLFLQVAGIHIECDVRQPPGSRIVRETAKIQRQPIHPDKNYLLATNDYIAGGKDGYDVLLEAKVILNADAGPQLSTLVRNHFNSVQRLLGVKKPKSEHRQRIISVAKFRRLRSKHVEQGSETRSLRELALAMQAKNDDVRSTFKKVVEESEKKKLKKFNAPKVEGRITIIGGGSEGGK